MFYSFITLQTPISPGYLSPLSLPIFCLQANPSHFQALWLGRLFTFHFFFLLRNFLFSLKRFSFFFSKSCDSKISLTDFFKSNYLAIFDLSRSAIFCCSWGTTGPHILGGALPVPHALLLRRTRWTTSTQSNMDWQPQDEPLRQLACCLKDSLNGHDQSIRKQAETVSQTSFFFFSGFLITAHNLLLFPPSQEGKVCLFEYSDLR